MTVFTATAIGLAVAALILFFTALILFFQWDIPAARRELKGQAFTDTVETLTSTLSSDGSVEAYRKMSALSRPATAHHSHPYARYRPQQACASPACPPTGRRHPHANHTATRTGTARALH